jgi:hypothetical protein
MVKLTNKGSNHAVKYLLALITEVEVEVEERLTWKDPLEIFNNNGAENKKEMSYHIRECHRAIKRSFAMSSISRRYHLARTKVLCFPDVAARPCCNSSRDLVVIANVRPFLASARTPSP